MNFKSLNIAVALIALLSSTSVMSAPVNINAADSASLAAGINGVGEKLGAAIVEDRQKNGPFLSIDDLTRVKGVGKRVIDENRDQLSTGTPDSN